MDSELMKYLGGGGAVLFCALAWRFQKLWRKDDEELKEVLEEKINAVKEESEKSLNSATGRIDKGIELLNEGQIRIHERISKNKDAINQKVDKEIQTMTKLITDSNAQTNDKMTTIIGKLSKIEGKLDIN